MSENEISSGWNWNAHKIILCYLFFSASYLALVVKASGLAAGKGVVVASSRSEACSAVHSILTGHKFGTSGDTVVVEELLEGEEVSVSVRFDAV
jgi:phosphoribosylamine--glycine ligase/phosphoribosylglycinamide formyltransferase/phosphoribosylformylglycinamidine cyclo-ligase